MDESCLGPTTNQIAPELRPPLWMHPEADQNLDMQRVERVLPASPVQEYPRVHRRGDFRNEGVSTCIEPA